jgi:2-keto-4-pentenoate hydratase
MAMGLTAEEQSLYDLIRRARASKSPVEGKNGDRGVDLAGAYRIQEASQGERVLKGYKLGLISPAKQQQMGIDTPIFGRIYADMLYQNGVTLADFVQPRMEPEIAIVLRDAVSPDASAEVVLQAIGGYFLGVDVLDSIWQDYRFTAPEVVADNTSGGGFRLAGRMSDHMESGVLRLYLNNELQTEGHADALGDPSQRLQWLAQQVGGLSAGMIVFLGSPAAAVPAKSGTLEVIGPDGHMMVAKLVA